MGTQNKVNPSFPAYGYIGLGLVLVAWYFNWSLEGLRTHLLFFPQWLGYCLFVDALVKKRKGTSLLSRSGRKYIGLFIISIPVWWLFELINLRSQNWHYLGREYFTDLEFFSLASISFSTVLPAVFGTAELVGTIKPFNNRIQGPRIPLNRISRNVIFMTGVTGLILLLLWPGLFYAFVWISTYLIVDAINLGTGNRNLIIYADVRNWQPMARLAVGCIVCGFFWELWNFYGYPKWVYKTPGVEFLYVFEMPLLGYLGYIPFSFGLFAIYHLITRTRISGENAYYIQV